VQRDIVAIADNERMNENVEEELTKLFEKEIQFNRVTEEIKQRMAASKTFCLNAAFHCVDDWNYGFIVHKNLSSFFRKHNYKASKMECMAVIRRFDLDADARLSQKEFTEGLTPRQTYSKVLKRNKMAYASRHQMSSYQPGLLKHNDDPLRIRSIESFRSASSHNRRSHRSFSNMKPVIMKDLAMFGSPGEQIRSVKNIIKKRRSMSKCAARSDYGGDSRPLKTPKCTRS
jgi:hypothetical protein